VTFFGQKINKVFICEETSKKKSSFFKVSIQFQEIIILWISAEDRIVVQRGANNKKI
jgi:hypothetical protein